MPTTKQELLDTLNQVGDSVEEMLNPALSREEIVEKLQALDESLNGDEDSDESEDEDADD